MSEIATISRSLLLPVTQKFRLPQSLIFFVTSRCNARCPFCLYYEQVSNPVAAKEELTVDEVNRIAAHYGTLHYLGISGGEPSLLYARIWLNYAKHLLRIAPLL